jgi:hypothetical protein
MRVTLLPREVAARVITGSLATLAWAAGLTVVVLTIPVLIDTLVRKGLADAIPVPLLLLVALLAAIGVCLWRTTAPVVLGYLVVASVIAVAYEVSLITTEPSLLENELFLVNRPTLALVAIGVASTTVVGGIIWCLFGYAAAIAVAALSAALTGTDFRPGFGPTMVLALAVVMNLTLFAIQARQRRKFPRFEELEDATRRLAASADLARRTTAVVHDTVLNDLAVVMNSPDALDARVRQALVDDLDTLEGGAWMRTTESVPVHDEEQARIRNEISRVASDFRWRGLEVNVTGAGTGVYVFGEGAGEALVGALRATLENVLKHSGTTTADVEIIYSDTEVTFMISDQGVGFDPAEVDPNRLGIRTSVMGRMEDVGGRVRVWSSPGTGTTVLIGVPVAEVRERRPPSEHQKGDYAERGE